MKHAATCYLKPSGSPRESRVYVPRSSIPQVISATRQVPRPVPRARSTSTRSPGQAKKRPGSSTSSRRSSSRARASCYSPEYRMAW